MATSTSQSTFAAALVGSNENAAGKVFTENGAIIEEGDHPGVVAFTKTVRSTQDCSTGKKKKQSTSRQTRRMQHQTHEHRTEEQSTTEYQPRTLTLEENSSAYDVKKHFSAMIEDAKNKLIEGHPDAIQRMLDTWVLPMFKRTIPKTSVKYADGTEMKHTGQGERRIAYQMFIELLEHFPETSLQLLRHFPIFGYWGDLPSIWQLLQSRPTTETLTDETKYQVYLEILSVTVQQLFQDVQDMNDGKATSLCGKWFPNEKSAKGSQCKITVDGKEISFYTAMSIVYCNFKNQGAADAVFMRQYVETLLKATYAHKTITMYSRTFRKVRSSLNAHLDVFEVKACAKEWSQINLKAAPAKTVLKNQLAILNEKLNSRVSAQDEDTGNRFPKDEDRVQARKNYLELITSGVGVNVSTLEAHDILIKYRGAKSTAQKMAALSQWTKKVEEVFQSLVEDEGLDINDPVSLKSSRVCSLMPMMDVSGSMTGIPMDVSVGLGLFILALQKKLGLEHQVCVSFTERPMAFDFTGLTLREQIDKLFAHVGYTTNFEAAIDLVLDAMRQSGTMKNLIVFTDGQFDAMNVANNGSYGSVYNRSGPSWTTCHHRILQKVASLGLTEAPNIIYWNLRDGTPGVQASAKHPGVQMLQGYTPELIKFALFGGEFEQEEMTVTADDGSTTTVKVAKRNAYDTFRAAMDQVIFDPIRQIVYDSQEGCLVAVVV